MQSEILYRRHLRRGDVFVHADLKGATPIVVKNRQGPNAPIPPSTLSQAGNLCVTTSSAWDSKAVMSAWWVPAAQVSKTTTGGLLPAGEFSIKGEKSFLAPSQLVLGFATMFQISLESLRNHKTARFDGPVEQVEPVEPVEDPVEGTQEEAADTAAENGEKGPEPEEPTGEEEPQPEPEPQAEHTRGEVHGEMSGETPDETGGNDKQSNAQDEGHEDGGSEDKEPQDEASEQEERVNTAQRELSARERRMLRQGKALDPTEEAPAAKTTAKQAPPKKKARAKKAAAKYADQDEEERDLALHLVGAKGAKAQKAAAAAETKESREKEAQAQKERRRAQHERAAEAERKRQAAFEEGADDYDEETAAAEAADLAWIPALIGTPHPDDEILAAIPVCAPWAALGRYKYRVKLQPGTVKKGKAVKEIHGRWISETTTGKVRKEHAEEIGVDRATAEKLRAREGELFKGWKDSEVVNTVPVGKVRIMIAGGDSKAKGGGGGGSGKGAKGGKGGKGKKK